MLIRITACQSSSDHLSDGLVDGDPGVIDEEVDLTVTGQDLVDDGRVQSSGTPTLPWCTEIEAP